MDTRTGLNERLVGAQPQADQEGMDPGQAVLDALRHFEPRGRSGRREFLASLAVAAGAVPLLGAKPLLGQQVVGRTDRTTFPPQYSARIMEPVNIHEIQEVAEKNLTDAVYHYITGGAEDEYTLRENLEAFRRTWLKPRFMVDVSRIDTSLELLGQRLDFPILLCPTTKNRVFPEGDRVSAVAAHACKAVYAVTNAAGWMTELDRAGQMPVWWGSTLGHDTRAQARDWARAQEEAGATALAITVDHRYVPNRDRNVRTAFPGYGAGTTRPVTPGMTWEYLDWIRSGSTLPIVVKGILRGEDAELAVGHGVQAIVVSNHGGRELDGAVPTLLALPEVVAAVAGRIPVLMDGGIRRGGDAVKALALGAKAVMIGRPYVWGLAAFGQIGVQRVVELLHAELKVAMGLSGVPNLAAIGRDLVVLPWER